MPKAKSQKPPPGVKVLILKLANGSEKEAKVEIPAESKVTFGPAIPGPSRDRFGSSVNEYAVRVYDGPTEKAGLLAVFTGVREFRLETIKVSRLVIRESGKSLWTSDEGGLEVSHSVKRDKKLIPDEF